MRGVPLHPVICSVCQQNIGCPSDHLCCKCRCSTQRTRKYSWTTEQEESLRRIYADNAHNKRRLSNGITAFVERHKFPRYIVTLHAQRLGITVEIRHKWSSEDLATLRELAGTKPVKLIARQLKRGHEAVAAMMDKQKLSRAVTTGYTREEVAMVLGVSPATITRWIGLRWLKVAPSMDRITESSVRHVVFSRPEQYSLKRVDEAWFKGMVFPKFGMREIKLSGQRQVTTEIAEEERVRA